jgi:predicted pyridoxine 5'-phosphate oxidase superfamily flavin-nucleotide-binding protein
MARTAALDPTQERFASDVAFSPAVKAVQAERGSRAAYARVERDGGFETTVTPALAELLAEIDTAFLATASAAGQPYVQHRGGPPGFIRVVDEQTLGFLDLVGNKQYVTTGNLRENDRVCLLVIDYARRLRVKIWGRARVVSASDPAAAKLALPGYGGRREQAILLTVTAWDANCPRHIPQKVDAAGVAEVVGDLRSRLATLEEENRGLKEVLAGSKR